MTTLAAICSLAPDASAASATSAAPPASAPAGPDAAPPANLLKFWQQYRLPRTLHCKTEISIDYKTIPPGIVHTANAAEYWSDGPRFRMVELIDPTMMVGVSHDVRWDGDRFQIFNMVSGLLIVTERPGQKTPYLSEPAPLVPWMFLNPAGAGAGVKATLDDVQSQQTLARLAEATPIGNDGTEFEFHVGRRFNTDCSYRIQFHGAPSFVPSRLILRSAAGTDLATMDITYQPVQCDAGVCYLPKTITSNTRTLDDRPGTASIITVTSIEADKPIPAETFTIDYQTAKRVVNLDAPNSKLTRYSPSNPPRIGPAATPPIAERTDGAQAANRVIAPGITVGGDTEGWTAGKLLLAALGVAALLAGVAIAYFRKSVFEGRQ